MFHRNFKYFPSFSEPQLSWSCEATSLPTREGARAGGLREKRCPRPLRRPPLRSQTEHPWRDSDKVPGAGRPSSGGHADAALRFNDDARSGASEQSRSRGPSLRRDLPSHIMRPRAKQCQRPGPRPSQSPGMEQPLMNPHAVPEPEGSSDEDYADDTTSISDDERSSASERSRSGDMSLLRDLRLPPRVWTYKPRFEVVLAVASQLFDASEKEIIICPQASDGVAYFCEVLSWTKKELYVNVRALDQESIKRASYHLSVMGVQHNWATDSLCIDPQKVGLI